MPNKYIGNNGDGRASMIDKDTSELKKKCNFRTCINRDFCRNCILFSH